MKNFSDPMEIFREAVAAVNASDWRRAAECCDPISLRAFHRYLCERYAPSQKATPMTAELLRQYQPDMPLEVAEYQAAQHNRHHEDGAARLSSELPGFSTPRELRETTAERVFIAWLEGQSPRRKVERQVEQGRVSQRVLEQMVSMTTPIVDLEPIGVVNDGDRLVHLLYRHAGQTDGPPSLPQSMQLDEEERALVNDAWGRTHPQSLCLRRQRDDSWRIVVEHDFLMLGGMTFIAYDGDEGEAHA